MSARSIKVDYVGNFVVSTVKTDMPWLPGMWYETLVFDRGEYDRDVLAELCRDHYETEFAAREGHFMTCKKLRQTEDAKP